jgi:hypothetical protein
MSKIGTPICRSFLLWWHIGIGPMIGAGPMQARPGRLKSGRARSAYNRRPLSASPKTYRARPIGERANAA